MCINSQKLLDMPNKILLSCCPSFNTLSLQFCYIPYELLLEINGSLNSYYKINSHENNSYVCKGIPTLNSTYKEEYELITTTCVSSTYDKNKPAKRIENSSVKNITRLKKVTVENIELNITVKLTSHVVKYKKDKSVFSDIIKCLLRSYGIIHKCIINCETHPIAKELGVSQIEITCNDLKENQVGFIKPITNLFIKNVISEQCIKMKVKSDEYLGGLSSLVNELCQLINLPTRFKGRNIRGGMYFVYSTIPP